MTTNTRHEPPRAIAVFQLQFRKMGRILRPELIGLALILSPTAIMALGLLMRRDAALDYPQELSFLLPAAAFLLPFRLWNRERLFNRGDFLLMPVERRKHILIRVCAGAVWALALAAMVVLLFNLLALTAGSPTIGAAWRWLVPLGSVATAYLLGSALVLALRHPLRWTVGLVLTFALLSAFDLSAPLEPMTRALVHGNLGLQPALTGGASITAWAVALLFWFGLSLIAVALASLRHRED